MYKILTIDGGGSLGLIPATLLTELEKELNYPLYSYFNMIAGTSTGASIGASIALGNNNFKDIYMNEIPNIFKNPSYVRLLFGSKYNTESFHRIMRKYTNVKFSEVKTKLMMNALMISGEYIDPVFWKSWENPEDNISDAVIASCSAPTYFDPYIIGENVYADGGLSTNNISTCALVEAIKLGVPIEDILILNMGTSRTKGFKKANKINSVIEWLPKLASSFISGSEEISRYQCKHFLKDNFMSIYSTSTNEMDCVNVKALELEGLELWKKNKNELITFLNQTS